VVDLVEIRYMDSVDSIIKNELHSHQLKTRELSLRNLREMRNIIQQEEDHKEILPIIHAITTISPQAPSTQKSMLRYCLLDIFIFEMYCSWIMSSY
jgi:hypothetical protein